MCEDLSQAYQPEAWLHPVDSLHTVGTSGAGNGNPLQYACLGNPMNRGALVGYSPCDYKELDTTEQLTHTRLGSVQRGSSLQ